MQKGGLLWLNCARRGVAACSSGEVRLRCRARDVSDRRSPADLQALPLQPPHRAGGQVQVETARGRPLDQLPPVSAAVRPRAPRHGRAVPAARLAPLPVSGPGRPPPGPGPPCPAAAAAREPPEVKGPGPGSLPRRGGPGRCAQDGGCRRRPGCGALPRPFRAPGAGVGRGGGEGGGAAPGGAAG